MIVVRTASGEEVEVESDRVLSLADIEAITGKGEGLLAAALVAEIRWLGTIIAQVPKPDAPVVNNLLPVGPPPLVSFAPQIVLDSPKGLEMDVIERDYNGRLKKLRLTIIR